MKYISENNKSELLSKKRVIIIKDTVLPQFIVSDYKKICEEFEYEYNEINIMDISRGMLEFLKPNVGNNIYIINNNEIKHYDGLMSSLNLRKLIN